MAPKVETKDDSEGPGIGGFCGNAPPGRGIAKSVLVAHIISQCPEPGSTGCLPR